MICKKYNISIRARSALNDKCITTGFKTLNELKQYFKNRLNMGRVRKTNALVVKELDQIKTIDDLMNNLSIAEINLSDGYQIFYSIIDVKKIKK